MSTMEIKVGDKVRVKDNYPYPSFGRPGTEFVVKSVTHRGHENSTFYVRGEEVFGAGIWGEYIEKVIEPVAPSVIEYGDMQAGDKVRVTDSRVVEVVRVTESGRATVKNASGHVYLLSRGADGSAVARDLELVERPVSELPTKIGSVIETGGDRFMLRRSHGYDEGLWQGATGSHDLFSQRQMHKEVEKRGAFTVIA